MRESHETTEQFVHRANIAKYRRILGTYLTDEERRFVERRLTEEMADLQQKLNGSGSASRKPSYAG